MKDLRKDQLILSITRNNPEIEYIIPSYKGGSVRIAQKGFTVLSVQKIKTIVSEGFFHIQLFSQDNSMIGSHTEFIEDLFQKREKISLFKNEVTRTFEFDI